MATASEITKLCDDWCKSVVHPDGGFGIGAKTEKFRLLSNGVQFHDLDYEALSAAVVGLSKVLLLPMPGLNTVISQDHYGLWSWCGELLLGEGGNTVSIVQGELKSLYVTAIHTALASCSRPPLSERDHEQQSLIRQLQSLHVQCLVRKNDLVLAFLGFPLLEATLRRACSTYVTANGIVLQDFSVQRKDGSQRSYKAGQMCNKVRDLLFLYYASIATQIQKSHIDVFNENILLQDETQHPFDLIGEWRDQSLHGTTSFSTIGGTVLNLVLLISLFEVERGFDQRRASAFENCQAHWRRGRDNSFYPPY